MSLFDIRSAFLPYCITQVEEGCFVILNREYKPLGQVTRDGADYRKHMVRIKGLTPAKARKISSRDSPDITSICLYDDGCIPTSSAANAEAYFRRLTVLMTLRVFPVGSDG